jgi:hypothetical protein
MDDEEIDENCLPNETILLTDDNFEAIMVENESHLADVLSDTYDFCVKSLDYTILDNSHLSESGYELQSGAVICYPDDGVIRLMDESGIIIETRQPSDEDYRDWKKLFE